MILLVIQIRRVGCTQKYISSLHHSFCMGKMWHILFSLVIILRYNNAHHSLDERWTISKITRHNNRIVITNCKMIFSSIIQ